jgi:periplasmic protein TonB
MDIAVHVLSPAREGVQHARFDIRAHHRIPHAFLASIVFHAAIFGLLAAYLTTPRQPPRAHDAYIYLIPTSQVRAGMDSSLAAANQTPESSRSKPVARATRRQIRPRQPFERVAAALKRKAPPPQLKKALPVQVKIAVPLTTAEHARAANASASRLPSSVGVPRADGVQSAPHGDGQDPVAGIEAPPAVLFNPLPIYPDAARQRAIEGEVRLRIVVDQSGRVERDIEVIESIPLLDQAAISAVEQWRFSPGRDRDGRPARTLLEVPVRFTLRNPD